MLLKLLLHHSLLQSQVNHAPSMAGLCLGAGTREKPYCSICVPCVTQRAAALLPAWAYYRCQVPAVAPSAWCVPWLSARIWIYMCVYVCMFYVATLLSFCLCSIYVLIHLLTYFSYEIWISNLSCSNKHAFISPFMAITLLQVEVVILLAE